MDNTKKFIKQLVKTSEVTYERSGGICGVFTLKNNAYPDKGIKLYLYNSNISVVIGEFGYRRREISCDISLFDLFWTNKLYKIKRKYINNKEKIELQRSFSQKNVSLDRFKSELETYK